MRVAIDAAGRIVLPKRFRDGLGLTGPGELEVNDVGGALELTVSPIRATVEDRAGGAAIVSDQPPTSPLTSEQVRREIERGRR